MARMRPAAPFRAGSISCERRRVEKRWSAEWPCCVDRLSPAVSAGGVCPRQPFSGGGGRREGDWLLATYSHYGYSRRVPSDREAIAAFLPLPPATFHILLALADVERH